MAPKKTETEQTQTDDQGKDESETTTETLEVDDSKPPAWWSEARKGLLSELLESDPPDSGGNESGNSRPNWAEEFKKELLAEIKPPKTDSDESNSSDNNAGSNDNPVDEIIQDGRTAIERFFWGKS